MGQYGDILKRNNLDEFSNGELPVYTPIDGSEIAKVSCHKIKDVDQAIGKAVSAFDQWKAVPAPVRGELIRLLGEELRAAKKELGELVTLECGKIVSEGLGEVQEMIDICDFAVGLSRQLYGLTIASERPGHHMREMWHPIGPVAVITAFNFPVAVWSWNTALAIICGDPVIWKPSEKTPLTAMACEKIFSKAVTRFKEAGHDCPDKLLQLLIGEANVGQALVDDPRIPLVSATGSTRMGKIVSERVAARLGKSLLELGGNNAMIVTPSADIDLAVRAIVFSAVGTAGQRCTTLRRLIAHESIKADLITALAKAYESLKVGSPLDSKTLIGPLIDEDGYNNMMRAVTQAKEQGGTIVTGGDKVGSDGYYVQPVLIDMPSQTEVVCHETFAPILYVMGYESFEDAIKMHNAVPQGLSSCIFTTDMREAETFLSSTGSDCGLANVNIGPSGAEIGGAFGGEKDTGGGRESGSDAWKVYMRRQTQTVNYSKDLPLAQGVVFEI